MKKLLSVLLVIAMVMSLMIPTGIATSAETSTNLLENAELTIANRYLIENANGTVSNTVEDFDSAVYNNLELNSMGAYRYEVNVTIDADSSKGNDYAPVVAFRGNNIGNSYVLQFWKTGISILALNNTELGGIGSYDYYESFDRQVGKTYNVVIESYYDKVKVIIDGTTCFTNKAADGYLPLPTMPALFGFAERWCKSTFEPVSLTEIEYDNPYLVPAKPEGNNNYVYTAKLSGPLASGREFYAEATPSGNSSSFMATPIGGNESYVFKATVYPSAVSSNWILFFFQQGYGIALAQAGAMVFQGDSQSFAEYDSSWVASSSCYTPGTAFNVTIRRDDGSVSLWINDNMIICQKSVPQAIGEIGVGFNGGCGRIVPTEIYRTTPENNPTMPTIPNGNFDYSTMSMKGDLATEDGEFCSETLVSSVPSLIETPIGERDAFLYKTTFYTDVVGSDQVQLIFRGTDTNYYLALAIFQAGVNLGIQNGFNFDPIKDAYGNDYWIPGMGYTLEEDLEVAILSEYGFVTVWLNGVCVYNKVAVPELNTLIGANYQNAAGTISVDSIFCTENEENEVCPVFDSSYTNLAETASFIPKEAPELQPITLSETPKRSQKTLIEYDVTLKSDLVNNDGPTFYFRYTVDEIVSEYLTLQMRNNLWVLSLNHNTADWSVATYGTYEYVTELNKAYHITIASGDGDVSIWIDNEPAFMNISVANEDNNLGVQLFESDSTIENVKVAAVSNTVGHSVSGDWVTTLEPTTTTYGIHKKYCEVCGKDIEEYIAKLSTVIGDVNGDTKVNVLDLIRLKKHLAGELVDINENASDFNADAKILGEDAVGLRKLLLTNNSSAASGDSSSGNDVVSGSADKL